MILLIDRCIVILTPPKTASDSLHRALCTETFGGLMVVGESMYPGNVDKHTMRIPNEASGFKILATVRHPLDRLVSLYCHYVRHESEYHGRWSMPFREFVGHVVGDHRITGYEVDSFYRMNQSQHLIHITPDGLLRCESLEANLLTYGIDVKLRRENTSHRRSWPEYFDDGLLMTVAPWAKSDCDAFGYSL